MEKITTRLLASLMLILGSMNVAHANCEVQLQLASEDRDPDSAFHGARKIPLSATEEIKGILESKGYHWVDHSDISIVMSAALHVTYRQSGSIFVTAQNGQLLHLQTTSPYTTSRVDGHALIQKGASSVSRQFAKRSVRGLNVLKSTKRLNAEMLVQLAQGLPLAESLDICR